MKKLFLTLAIILSWTHATAAERWYDEARVERGNGLFQQHCAVCHGSNAEGTLEWKKRDANGHFPPPPLNGSAHAWHHPLEQLSRYIKQGGVPLGGVMPAFGEQLGDDQILDLISFFQSKWSDEIYTRWFEHVESR